MGFVEWLTGKPPAAQVEERGAEPFYQMAAAFDAGTAYGWAPWVSEESALRVSTVLACVRLLSGTLAGLPLHVYRRIEGGKERETDTPLAQVLSVPNTWQTGFKWRETIWMWTLLYGNGCSRIVRDRSGDPVALQPLDPNNLEFVDAADGGLAYKVNTGAQHVTYGAWEVLHLRGLTGDGRIGYGVIENLMRENLALALSLQGSAGSFYANSSRPDGVLNVAHALKQESRDRLRREWEQMHRGTGNSGRVAILEGNDKYTPISVPPDQAQFLESRQYSVQEIARAFGVPPHLVGDPTAQSYASAEQNNLEFVQYTLLPWARNFEDEIWRTLLLPSERARWFAEHRMQGLLRGDTKSRMEAYAIGVQNGWMNRNEVRELENLNAVDGLDEFLAPLNMTTAPALAAAAEDTITGTTAAPGEGPEPLPPAPTPTARNDENPDAKAQREQRRKELQQQEKQLLGRVWSGAELPGLLVRAVLADLEIDEAPPALEEDEGPDDDLLTPAQHGVRRDRQELIATFRTLWTDAAARLVKREAADLQRKLGSVGTDRPAFEAWLVEFYRELQPKIPGYFAPVLTASVRGAAKSVQGELGVKVPRSFDDFVAAFLANLSAAWVLGSEGQIAALLGENAGAAGLEAVEGRVTEWEEKRADKEGLRQSVDSINAATIASYALVGVAATVWAARGKSCPFCRKMHGRRAAVGSAFIDDGVIVDDDGNQMRIHGKKSHPGLHAGCDCVIVSA